jgi:hypothetical protein
MQTHAGTSETATSPFVPSKRTFLLYQRACLLVCKFYYYYYYLFSFLEIFIVILNLAYTLLFSHASLPHYLSFLAKRLLLWVTIRLPSRESIFQGFKIDQSHVCMKLQWHFQIQCGPDCYPKAMETRTQLPAGCIRGQKDLDCHGQFDVFICQDNC